MNRKATVMVDRKTDSDKLAKRLGRRIAIRRKSLGWTQDGLAERVAVDSETISRFERGAHLPSLPTLERLATVLRVEVGELLSKSAIAKASDSDAIAAWMEGLSADDRGFVLKVIRNCCDHLQQKSESVLPRKKP